MDRIYPEWNVVKRHHVLSHDASNPLSEVQIVRLSPVLSRFVEDQFALGSFDAN
jgi:hypothetical protein